MGDEHEILKDGYMVDRSVIFNSSDGCSWSFCKWFQGDKRVRAVLWVVLAMVDCG